MLEILRRVFDFNDWSQSNPGTPPPGDMLDASFAAQDAKINEVLVAVSSLQRSDGNLQNGIVSWDSFSSDLKAKIVSEIALRAADFADSAQSAASIAQSAAISAKSSEISALDSADSTDSAKIEVLDAKITVLEQVRGLITQTQETLSRLQAAEIALQEARTDYDDSGALAEAWARSSALWAEHMPDTLPDNAVKIMDITGDHWSSRWWANRADNAFGRLTDLYLGAWPDPPTQNLEGGPIEVGSIYYDTDSQQPYVWDGSTWQPFWSPQRSVTATLWYTATAGQTVISLSTYDMNNNVYTLKGGEGIDVHINGLRVKAGVRYTVNYGANTITFSPALAAGDLVGIDVLASPSSFAGAAPSVWAMVPPVPNGTLTTFTLVARSGSAPAIAIGRSEELVVSLDGVIQEPGVSYTATSNTITFAVAPETSSHVFISWLQPALSQPGPAGPPGPTGPAGPPGVGGDWNTLVNKPSTFPPTLPIPSSGVTGLDAAQSTQDSRLTAIENKNTVQDAAIALKEGAISAGNTAQYWRGDKSWQTLDKSAVGLSNVDNTSDANKPVSTATQTALNLKEDKASKGVANGYASLDGSAKVPASQLPAYVDDVLEYANLAAFPGTGSSGIIYVALDTGKIYRWSGSAYIEISPSPGSTDAVPEGLTNLYYTNARASAAAPVQSVAGRTGAVVLTKADVGLSNVSNIAQVTQVTGTAPVASSGGTTPAISMQPATASVDGYLKATDFVVFSAKGSVTSVSGTAPVVSSGGNTPAISMPAATASVDGYLKATDWTLFNGKADLASPLFTGDPRAPTPAVGDNDTSIATTAWVKLQGYTSGATVGEAPNDGKLYGRQSLSWSEVGMDIGTF